MDGASGLARAAPEQSKRRPPFAINVRGSILRLACILILGCLSTATLFVGYLISQSRQQIANEALGIARASAQASDREITGAWALMSGLSTSPSLKTGDLRSFHRQLIETPKPQDSWIVLLSLDGTMLASSRDPFDGPKPRLACGERCQATFRTREPQVSDLVLTTGTSQPVVRASMPVIAGDEVAFVLGIPLPSEMLSRVFEERRLPEGWTGALYDRNGATITRSTLSSETVGQAQDPLVWAEIGLQSEGLLETRNKEGVPAPPRVCAVQCRLGRDRRRAAFAVQRPPHQRRGDGGRRRRSSAPRRDRRRLADIAAHRETGARARNGGGRRRERKVGTRAASHRVLGKHGRKSLRDRRHAGGPLRLRSEQSGLGADVGRRAPARSEKRRATSSHRRSRRDGRAIAGAAWNLARRSAARRRLCSFPRRDPGKSCSHRCAMRQAASCASSVPVATSPTARRTKQRSAASKRPLRAEDDERQRIAQERPTSTAQHLVGASLFLEVLARRSGSDSAEAKEAIAEIHGLIHRAQNEIRLLSYVMHPQELARFGLSAAVRAHVEGFARKAALNVKVELVDDLGDLPYPAQLALFRILQEALTNVHRHANATSALVRLEVRAGRLFLAIKDDGQGGIRRDRNGRPRPFGLGLMSMSARVRQLGGRLRVAGRRGTVIAATIPLAATRPGSPPRGRSPG